MERKFIPAPPDAYHPASFLHNATSVAGVRGLVAPGTGKLGLWMQEATRGFAGERVGGSPAPLPAALIGSRVICPTRKAEGNVLQLATALRGDAMGV